MLLTCALWLVLFKKTVNFNEALILNYTIKTQKQSRNLNPALVMFHCVFFLVVSCIVPETEGDMFG